MDQARTAHKLQTINMRLFVALTIVVVLLAGGAIILRHRSQAQCAPQLGGGVCLSNGYCAAPDDAIVLCSELNERGGYKDRIHN